MSEDDRRERVRSRHLGAEDAVQQMDVSFGFQIGISIVTSEIFKLAF